MAEVIDEDIFKSFLKSQFPHKSINVIFILVTMKEELMDLWENWLFQIDFMNTLCETKMPNRKKRWREDAIRNLIQTSIDDKYWAQWKSLHFWIILVIVRQHLLQTGRIDGPTEYAS